MKKLLIIASLLLTASLARAASIVPTCNSISPEGIYLCTWSNMANGDTGTIGVSSATYMASSDRAVQVTGTFGSGGSVSIKGTLDGTNYEILTDPQGNAITLTASGLKQITELTKYVIPAVTAGDGTTLLTVKLLMKRVQ